MFRSRVHRFKCDGMQNKKLKQPNFFFIKTIDGSSGATYIPVQSNILKQITCVNTHAIVNYGNYSTAIKIDNLRFFE